MNDAGKQPSLYIVIPVLNHWEQTRRCLAALYAGSRTDFSVVVVDHGSTDGTAEHLAREFPAVQRLAGNTDMWWSAATNAGVQHALAAGATDIMLLNNDCNVRADTYATLAAQRIAHPDAIIAPLQASQPGGHIDTRRLTTCFLLGFPTLKLPGRRLCRGTATGLQRVRLIMGGRGVLIPAAVFRQVGLFDAAALPHYGADHDFYLRARDQGITLAVACQAIVDVDASTTTLAARLGQLPLRGLLRSLRERRSHRNIPELTALFRRHYPLPGLYPVGVALNVLRYLLVYAGARLATLTGCTRHADKRGSMS